MIWWDNMLKRQLLIRSITFQTLIDDFLVSAVGSILAIRIYLELTGYPQIGTSTLHISHMLWGGLLMLIAVFLPLIFLNNQVKKWTAIFGGLGFGVFIDELGKFITADNNYFYRPTFALIYIIFIVLYILLRTLYRRQDFSQKEYLINSLEFLKEAVINDLDDDEKKLALSYLDKTDPKDVITGKVRSLFKQLDTIPIPSPHFFTRCWQYTKELYFTIVKKTWFIHAVIVLFVAKSVFSLTDTYQLTRIFLVVFIKLPLTINSSYLHFSAFAYMFSAALAGVFVILGIWKLRSSRFEAYRLLKRSLLVSILLTQVFQFYREPILGFIGVTGNIILYSTLSFMIEQEKIY